MYIPEYSPLFWSELFYQTLTPKAQVIPEDPLLCYLYILNHLNSHSESVYFSDSINDSIFDYPTYNEIVETPMYFNLVITRILNHYYDIKENVLNELETVLNASIEMEVDGEIDNDYDVQIESKIPTLLRKIERRKKSHEYNGNTENKGYKGKPKVKDRIM